MENIRAYKLLHNIENSPESRSVAFLFQGRKLETGFQIYKDCGIQDFRCVSHLKVVQMVGDSTPFFSRSGKFDERSEEPFDPL